MIYDGGEHYSVYDFMTHMCRYGDNGKAARKEFSRLIQDASEYQREVAALCRYLKFPGRGQKETPCIAPQELSPSLILLYGQR